VDEATAYMAHTVQLQTVPPVPPYATLRGPRHRAAGRGPASRTGDSPTRETVGGRIDRGRGRS
jgi:hypothetical protein